MFENPPFRFVHVPLLHWLFRPLRRGTLGLSFVAAFYVLATQPVLEFDMLGWVPYFILVHCILIVWIPGRVGRASFGFLYVQGYDRDTLWRHTMLAGVMSAMCVWVPCSLLIWFRVRSAVQATSGNFNFPLMAPTEDVFPLWCLLAYSVLIPVFHYAWIRGGQSTRGSASGFVIAVATVLVAFSIWNGVRVPDMPPWTIIAMAGGFFLAAFSLLVAGRQLHRRLEVLS